jgi:hypothetical protein
MELNAHDMSPRFIGDRIIKSDGGLGYFLPDGYDARVSGLMAPGPAQQGQAAQHHGHAQPLAHAHPQGQQAQVGIGFTEKLGHKPEKTIAQQKGPRNLACGTVSASKPP